MNITLWSLPSILLILFSIVSIFIVIFIRIFALRAGQITLKDFMNLHFYNKNTPKLEIASHYLSDLFHGPILFYISNLIILLNPHLMSLTCLWVLCWLYLGFKVLHSTIMITYNHLLHRLTAYLFSNAFLLTLIIMILIDLYKR